MLLAPLANYLVFRPTRNQLPHFSNERRLIPFRGGHLEVLITRTGDIDDEPRYFTLNFPGAEGRAERLQSGPLDSWEDIPGECWAVNPPGYGASTGSPKLSTMASAADAVFREFHRAAEGRPTFLQGFCMGGWLAMHLAANHSVNGLILRNTANLKSMMMHQHGWKGLWLGTYFLTWEAPRALNVIRNARQITCPAVFVVSLRDTVSPPVLQQRVIDAYAGPKQILQLPRAGHLSGMTRRERSAYCRLLGWLRQRALALSGFEPSPACEENDGIALDSDHGVWVAGSAE